MSYKIYQKNIYQISKMWSNMLGSIKYAISHIDTLMAIGLLQIHAFKIKNSDKFYFKQLL